LYSNLLRNLVPDYLKVNIILDYGELEKGMDTPF